MYRKTILTLTVLALGAAPAFAVDTDLETASLTPPAADKELARDVSPERMSLERGADGGVLPSLTIEAEDQVSIRFERPDLALDLQPRSAPGLEWENTWDKVDLFPVVTDFSSLEGTPYAGKPWLNEIRTGDVVVFRPVADRCESWRLTIVDSRGRPAVTFGGNGEPPAEIAWNGCRADGTPAWPGLIYTHTLETTDRAGNVRTFTGEGFELPPYRVMEKDGVQLVLDGARFPASRRATAGARPELVDEMASWLNQIENVGGEIEIHATARTRGQARRLADAVAMALDSRVVGPRDRVRTDVLVVRDAPDEGMIVVSAN